MFGENIKLLGHGNQNIYLQKKKKREEKAKSGNNTEKPSP